MFVVGIVDGILTQWHIDVITVSIGLPPSYFNIPTYLRFVLQRSEYLEFNTSKPNSRPTR